jgi:transmembrane sensor
MNNSEFKALLNRYNTSNCSPEEKVWVENWYAGLDLMENAQWTADETDRILSMQPPVLPSRKTLPLWKWISSAAALILTISAVFYMFNKPVKSDQVAHRLATDVEPGRNKAVLTLASGKQIALTDAKTGVLANEADADVLKTADGEVVYNDEKDSGAGEEVMLHTMSTPRGGQYHLVLADGTKIWLNAASSITYPVHFSGPDRRVEITGEVYFEVAHLAGRTFHVVSRGQEIKVLGTHFNINAYGDEPLVKTTLLEGSVSVRSFSDDATVQLKPGEQAVLSATNLYSEKADSEQVMAWHEGDFVFHRHSIEEIMRMISRWYAVDIEYEHFKPVKQSFTGVVSRSRNLSAVMSMIKKSVPTLKYEIRGDKVSISN